MNLKPIFVSMDRLLYITEEDLQSQQAPKCDLLVHIGFRTIQFAVIDNGREQLKAVAEYKLPEINSDDDLVSAIQDLPEAYREFKFPFNKIKIAADNFQFTFVPIELYEESKLDDYVKFIKPSDGSVIIKNQLITSRIQNISFLSQELNSALNKVFHNPLIVNQATSFINGIKKYDNRSGSKIYLDIYKEHIQIAGVSSGDLLFYNVFETQNKDDVMYFIHGLISEYGVHPDTIEIIFSGNIRQGDELHTLVGESFEKINFADIRNFIALPDSFHDLPLHRYFALLSLDQCG